MKRLSTRNWWVVLGLTWAALIGSILLSADFGLAPVPLWDVLHFWWTGDGEVTALQSTLVEIRLRRGLMAVLCGASLSLAGCALQALLRNPLAEPYVLGIAGGASLGAVLAMLTRSAEGSNWLVPTGHLSVVLGATLGALLALWIVYQVARDRGRLEVRSMILAGVVLQVFLSAVVLVVWTLADRSVVNAHIQWMIGRIPDPPSLSAITTATGLTALGWIGLRLDAVAFNALGAGEESAAELGVNVERLKLRTFLLASMITGVVVSLCGLIGFVGLVVPHSARVILGPEHRRLLTASALLGALFLLWSDTTARTAFGAIALPVGAITALCGGPFFLWLLARDRRQRRPQQL